MVRSKRLELRWLGRMELSSAPWLGFRRVSHIPRGVGVRSSDHALSVGSSVHVSHFFVRVPWAFATTRSVRLSCPSSSCTDGPSISFGFDSGLSLWRFPMDRIRRTEGNEGETEGWNETIVGVSIDQPPWPCDVNVPIKLDGDAKRMRTRHQAGAKQPCTTQDTCWNPSFDATPSKSSWDCAIMTSN